MHAGLDALAAAVQDGTLVAQPGDEDVHGALEAALIAEVGAELGGKLRAGRSRNDQIATLVRLYLRDHAAVIAHDVLRVIDAIVAQAPGAVMVHLHGTRDVLGAHLEGRSDHFMPATLLDSQLATLEPLEGDERGFVVDVDQAVSEILDEVRARLVSV